MLDELLMTIAYVISFVPAVRLLYYPFERVMPAKKIHQMHLIMLGLFLLLFGETFIWFVYFSVDDIFYKVNSGVFYLLFFGLLYIFNKEKRVAILFNFGVVGICILTLSSIAGFAVDTFPMKYLILELALTYYVLLAIVYVPVRWFIERNTETLLPIRKGSEWSDIWMLPFSILIVSVFSVPLENHKLTLFELICRLMCGAFAMFISYYLSHSREVQLEKQRIMATLEDQKEYYEELSKSVQAERKVRHDFRHAIMAVRTYIDRNDKDGLAAYCERLLETSSCNMEMPYTGHPIADGIYYRYSQLAKENNISFVLNGRIRDDSIDDMDVCLILGNALENALEACCRMKEGERRIEVWLEEKETLLTITVQNTFTGNIRSHKDKFFSAKRSGQEEGFGLRSIREVCEKYGGTMHVDYENNVFHLMMFLNKSDKE